MKFFNLLTASAALLLMLSCCPLESDGSKILALFPFPGKSHFMMYSALLRELLERDHEVTAVTAITMKNHKLGQNYTEILIEPVYNFWGDIITQFKANNIFDFSDLSVLEFEKLVEIIGVATTEHALKQRKVQALINDPQPKGKFDLLLSAQFHQESFLALAHVYDIPVVTISTLGYENHMSQMMGLIQPWSFVPHGFTSMTDHMSFTERFMNTFYSLAEDLLREYRYFPQMDHLVQKYFGHLKIDFPPVAEMERNVSLMLLNSHTPLTSVRPTLPSMIPVGGMHIYPPKKLPADMQKFMDEAEHGVVYFSLGSNVQSKDMPPEKIRIFLDVFGSLKQRVIWKFENESIEGLPKNVLIKSWLPQNEILAHPNMKVFITHGGLFGTQEGVYHGVPMLGIPIYCDQHLNIKKAAINGYAIGLQYLSISHENLKESLHKLLNDPSYSRNVKKISAVFRDRPMGPRETAAYWVEHVIRHKGASHLRSAGLDLKWYQFYLLDVIAVAVFVPVLMLLTVIFVIRSLTTKKAVTASKTGSGKKSKKSKVN